MILEEKELQENLYSQDSSKKTVLRNVIHYSVIGYVTFIG